MPATTDEGLPAATPPIPTEAMRLGVTEANRDKEFSLALPATHWSQGMKKGEVKIENGAVYQHRPSAALRRPLWVEVSLQDQPGLEVPMTDGTPANLQKVNTANKALVKWLASHNGRSLNQAQQTRLVQLYADAHVQGARLGAAALKAKTEAERESLRDEAVTTMAGLLLEERKLFERNTQAQVERYGRPIIEQSQSRPTQKELEAALTGLFRGDYLDETNRRQPVRAEREENGTERIATSIATRGISFRLRSDPAVDLASHLAGTHTVVSPLGPPVILGYEARLYLAEHDILPYDGELMFGVDGLVHTSVVGGVWILQEQESEVRTYDRNIGFELPANESARRRSPFGRLRSTHRERRVTAMFAGWVVANGAASTYFADDELTLFEAITFPSFAQADRWLAGLTPTDRGKYYPIRGCSYAKGNYGYHWVCHQTANAFAARKWNLVPVQYPSCVLFGPCGLLGISERLSGIPGDIQEGCVPGVQCFYNVVPPWAEPVQAQLLEPLMDGHGWGLEVHWNPRRGEWVQSRAKFSVKSVPIPGWNETISATRI